MKTKSSVKPTLLAMYSPYIQSEAALAKSRIKKEAFKILGKGPQSLAEEKDDEIYEDYGYQVLLKEFLEQEEIEPVGDDENINMTQKFL